MSEFYSGRTGEVIFSNNPVAKIRDWSIETTVELLSTNSIDSGVNTFVPGVKGATGSATLMYYRISDDENTVTDSEESTKTEFTELLGKIMKVGNVSATNDRVALTLKVGSQDKDQITFNAYITSASISVSTGEIVVVPINFTVDGDFSAVIGTNLT
tara:strand:+ start:4609 stop:5079 length:471 start_codon:yes stop_codon:yes gene_type:complete